jgi:hypothetical protein
LAPASLPSAHFRAATFQSIVVILVDPVALAIANRLVVRDFDIGFRALLDLFLGRFKLAVFLRLLLSECGETHQGESQRERKAEAIFDICFCFHDFICSLILLLVDGSFRST